MSGDEEIMREVERRIGPVDPICTGDEARRLYQYIKRYMEDNIRAQDILLEVSGSRKDVVDTPVYKAYEALKALEGSNLTCRDVINVYTMAVMMMTLDIIASAVNASSMSGECRAACVAAAILGAGSASLIIHVRPRVLDEVLRRTLFGSN